jgi:hypothetical protein
VREWNQEAGKWPDDWTRWQRALDDALGYRTCVELGGPSMTAVRVTKFERQSDFFTTNVTPENSDPVRVDTCISSWTFIVDQTPEPASRGATRSDPHGRGTASHG